MNFWNNYFRNYI